jgi:hypothetical protein
VLPVVMTIPFEDEITRYLALAGSIAACDLGKLSPDSVGSDAMRKIFSVTGVIVVFTLSVMISTYPLRGTILCTRPPAPHASIIEPNMAALPSNPVRRNDLFMSSFMLFFIKIFLDEVSMVV